MTIFSTHDEQFFKRDVEATRGGSDLIGEAKEELVVWDRRRRRQVRPLVPFENPKEFVACVVRNREGEDGQRLKGRGG